MPTTGTFQVASVFPTGTSVGAYKITNWPSHAFDGVGAPVGAADSIATVSADGTINLAGLTANTTYRLAGQVSAVWTYMRIGTFDATVGGATSSALAKKGDDPKISELAVWGESYTQHGGKGFEDNWLTIWGEKAGVNIRNNGKSGSKLIFGEGESPNVTGTPMSQQAGGWGNIVEDTIRELKNRNYTAYSDAPLAITTLQPLMANAPSLLVYGPNDLAAFGNTQAVADTYANALRYAISARRVGLVVTGNNSTFHTFTGTKAISVGFTTVNGGWGLSGGTVGWDMSTGSTASFVLPTDLKDGMTMALFRGVKTGSAGSMAVQINGSAAAGSPFVQPTAPPNSTFAYAHVNRIPLTAAMAGQTVTLTFTVSAGVLTYGGVGFEPSPSSSPDGCPAPVLVANCPRLPDAAAASFFAASASWTGPPTDAGTALLNTAKASVVGEFDRFVGLVDIDSLLAKSTPNFNPGDVHPSSIGAHLMAPAPGAALAAMNFTAAEGMKARSMVKRPWGRVDIIAPTGVNFTWASQPTADTILGGLTNFAQYVELSRFTEYRIIANVATASTGGKLYAKYSVNDGGGWTLLSYDGLYTAAPPVEAVDISATGIRKGSWWPMFHIPRNYDDSLVTVFGTCTTISSPVFRSIQLQFR